MATARAELPRIRPSKLPLWAKCPASRRESAGIVDAGNAASRSGDMWHAVKSLLMAGREPNAGLLAAEYGTDIEDAELARQFV